MCKFTFWDLCVDVMAFVLCTVLQPVVVVSAHGAGRAGCLCSVAVAHELMTARQENPDCWTQDGHILDEVHGRNSAYTPSVISRLSLLKRERTWYVLLGV